MLDLPAPFGPISAREPPGRDREADVVECLEARELQRHVLDAKLEPGRLPRPASGWLGQPSTPPAVVLVLGVAGRRCLLGGGRRGTTPSRSGRRAGRRSAPRARSCRSRGCSRSRRSRGRRARSARRAASRCRGRAAPRAAASKMSSITSGASPSETSSRRRRRGAAISARPIATICCSPPESQPACCLTRSLRRGKRSKICAIESSTPGLARAEAPTRRFSSTVSSLNTWRPSGTWATPAPHDPVRAACPSGSYRRGGSRRRGSNRGGRRAGRRSPGSSSSCRRRSGRAAQPRRSRARRRRCPATRARRRRRPRGCRRRGGAAAGAIPSAGTACVRRGRGHVVYGQRTKERLQARPDAGQARRLVDHHDEDQQAEDGERQLGLPLVDPVLGAGRDVAGHLRSCLEHPGMNCQTSVPSTVPMRDPSPPITIIAMKPIANSSVKRVRADRAEVPAVQSRRRR